MEFWGVEVKAGETLKVSPGVGNVIHLSQAALGESKKGKESVPVHVKVGEQKLVIGTLSADKFPQIQYDVVFEKDFELSHNSKNGSVYFCGYRAQSPEEEKDEMYSSDDFDSDSEDEELPIENETAAKPVSAGNSQLKIEQLAKGTTADSDEDASDDDLSDSDDLDVSDDDEMDASSDEEDEKTPTPKKDNKKRPNEPASKTPVPSKKAKIATPQKSADGKKIATPHTHNKQPKSENGKTAASSGKATCNSCSKTFNSEKALDSHSKAKHAAAAAK